MPLNGDPVSHSSADGDADRPASLAYPYAMCWLGTVSRRMDRAERIELTDESVGAVSSAIHPRRLTLLHCRMSLAASRASRRRSARPRHTCGLHLRESDDEQ